MSRKFPKSLIGILPALVAGVLSLPLVAGEPPRIPERSSVVQPVAAKAFPEIAFISRTVKSTVECGVGEVDLTYDFANKSDLPLVVEDFTVSCGCMLGTWDGHPVEPGASGRIKAKFLTKGLRGTITKSLLVRFVGFGAVELSAEVTIP